MPVACVEHPLTRLRICERFSGLGKQPPDNHTEYFVAEELRLWPNQKVISYFFDHESDDFYHDRKEAFVITAMKEYEKYANVNFIPAETRSSATTRIAFPISGGTHWTAIGTDASMVNLENPTMNLVGIDLVNQSDTANFTIALHAIGHLLGLKHEDHDTVEDSIMKYSSTDFVEDISEAGLADFDKAWLTLNYPKALVNQDGGAVDIWTLRRALRVLNVKDEYSLKILGSDDLSEKRLLYLQSAGGVQGSLSADTIQKMMVEARNNPGECPTATARSWVDIASKPQDRAAPTTIGPIVPDGSPHLNQTVQSILDHLRILEVSNRSSAFNYPSQSNLDGNNIMMGIPSQMQNGDSEYAGELLEQPLTRAELNDLMEFLPDLLDLDPNPDSDLPGGVQHGLFTPVKNFFSSSSKTLLNLVRELPGLVRTSKKSIDVRNLTPNVIDTIMHMLQNDRPENVFQEVHSLCFASTLAHDASGKQTDLQGWLQKCLQSVLPELRNLQEGDQTSGWTLAWGPVVWKVNPDDDSSGPDLVWYIAHKALKLEGESTTRSTYAIAIAGTQMRSLHTWFNSNIDVFNVVDFERWLSNLHSDPRPTPSVGITSDKPYVSRGTAHTIWRLLTVKAPGVAAGEETLRGFLESRRKSDPGFRLIITGHSLGGALTPTLAVVLNEAKIVPSESVLTYFIAGPSPGNNAFAQLFAKTFQAIPKEAEEQQKRKYQVWNLNIVNERDPVPQAWGSDERTYPKQNLSNVHKQFPQHLAGLVKRPVETILQVLLDKKLNFAPLQSQIFRAPSSLEGVLPQHSEAYHDYIGIVPPLLTVALGR